MRAANLSLEENLLKKVMFCKHARERAGARVKAFSSKLAKLFGYWS